MTKEIQQYLLHIKNVRRYSSHTIVAYRTDINQFKSFCKRNLLKVTRKEVRYFLLNLKTQGYSCRTINRKLEVIRSFYRYYRRHTDYNSFPCAFIRPLRFTKKQRPYLAYDKVKCILDSIDPGTDHKRVRDQVVLELLYHTGCRASEIINLKKESLNMASLCMRVTGKGKYERVVPLSKRMVKLIRLYIKMWKRRNTGPYLLTTDKGRQLYPMYLWRLIRRYFKKDETGICVSAHTFRHSFAAHLYHNRAPVNAIRDLLGHKTLRSTSAYLHLDIEQLIKVFRGAHPKD